jgi:hypothetical protein
MLGPTIEAGPLFNPKKEPSRIVMLIIDTMSWLLPTLAAISSIAGGIAALRHLDRYAATLGIVAGIVSALGVICTGWASRIRDRRMEIFHALGTLSLDVATRPRGDEGY